MTSIKFTGGGSLSSTTLPTQTSAYHFGGWSKFNSSCYSAGGESAIFGTGTNGGSSFGALVIVHPSSTNGTILVFGNGGTNIDTQNFLSGSNANWFAWIFQYSGSGNDYTFRYRFENDSVWQTKTLNYGSVINGGNLYLGTDQFTDNVASGNVKGFWCQANVINDSDGLTASRNAALGIAPAGTNLHWLSLISDSVISGGLYPNGGTAGSWAVTGTPVTDASEPSEGFSIPTYNSYVTA